MTDPMNERRLVIPLSQAPEVALCPCSFRLARVLVQVALKEDIGPQDDVQARIVGEYDLRP